MQAEEASCTICQIGNETDRHGERCRRELWRCCESRANEDITNRQKDREYMTLFIVHIFFFILAFFYMEICLVELLKLFSARLQFYEK